MQILDLGDDLEMRQQQLEALETKYNELSEKFKEKFNQCEEQSKEISAHLAKIKGLESQNRAMSMELEETKKVL